MVTLRRMGRFSDAVSTTQQLIDRLQSSADEYDPAIIQVYMQLAETYQMQKDWEHLEQTLLTSIALCDNTHCSLWGKLRLRQSRLDGSGRRRPTPLRSG